MCQATFDTDRGWFQQLFASSPDPTWIIDDKRIVECNEAAVRTLGYASREELLNVHPAKLSPPRQPDGQDSRVKAESMMALARDRGLHRFEWMHKRIDGTSFVAEVTLAMVKTEARAVIYCTWRDITERKHAEDKIRNLAFYDTLTQLPNRHLLSDRLNQIMAASKRGGRYGALMFLDLDNFKPLNDAHGHVVGDMLLIEAAQRLRSCVRESDTVARFGGDEFVVLLGDLDAELTASRAQAEIVAEKIRTSLSQPYRLSIRREGTSATCIEHRCTVSIGVTLFMNHDSSQDDILRWADQAMYEAKQTGRNSIRFHDA